MIAYTDICHQLFHLHKYMWTGKVHQYRWHLLRMGYSYTHLHLQLKNKKSINTDGTTVQGLVILSSLVETKNHIYRNYCKQCHQYWKGHFSLHCKHIFYTCEHILFFYIILGKWKKVNDFLLWHLSPIVPLTQIHVKLRNPSTQVPSLSHGLLLHSSISETEQ